MKKKYSASIKDEKDWSTFTKELKNIYDKDSSLEDRNKNRIQNKPSLEHKPTSNEKNSRESIDVNKNKETTNTD